MYCKMRSVGEERKCLKVNKGLRHLSKTEQNKFQLCFAHQSFRLFEFCDEVLGHRGVKRVKNIGQFHNENNFSSRKYLGKCLFGIADQMESTRQFNNWFVSQ